MKTYLRLILGKIVSAFCERWDLVLENVALRHQIEVFERSGRRPQFTNADRLVWVVLSTVWPRWPEALEIVNVDTVKRWRRQGFRHYLLGKSRRRRPGRPAIESEIQSLIRRMSRQNGLLGRTPNPRRASETWRGCLPDHGRKIHGPPRWPTVTALGDISSQSRPGTCPQRNIFKTHQKLSNAYHLDWRRCQAPADGYLPKFAESSCHLWEAHHR